MTFLSFVRTNAAPFAGFNVLELDDGKYAVIHFESKSVSEIAC
jgi:hypothetical protein